MPSTTLPTAARDLERWLGPLLLLVAATVISSLSMERLPATDELYTVLAAKGWAATGEPVIAQGVYERSQLYTVLVGSLFRIFGTGLGVARALSVVAGGLLVLAVFLWTRRVAGSLAAWIAALFLCLSPLHIYISQFARFYALFGLVFWLGAIGLYHIVEQGTANRSQAILIGAATLVCLTFALHLQILAGMGLLGVALWFAATHGAAWLSSRDASTRRRLLFASALGALALVGVLLASGMGADLWAEYRSTPAWNREHRSEFWFYHVLLNQRFQTLWPLFPFLAIVAIAARPRPALFCFFVFCTGLLLLSFGGMKDRRYIAFLLPFLFVLWGIALAQLIPFLRQYVAPRIRDALGSLAPALARPRWQRVALTLSVLFLFAANGAPMKTLFGLAGVQLIAEGSGADMTSSALRGDWQAAEDHLRPWLEEADVVIATHDLETLHFLGPYDFTLSRNRVSEIKDGEFAIDPRTGIPALSEPESVDKLIGCFASGLIIGDASMWTQAVPEPTSAVIEARTVPIKLPRRTEIVAFRWQHARAPDASDDCADLPNASRP